jgi:hypothetical protein
MTTQTSDVKISAMSVCDLILRIGGNPVSPGAGAAGAVAARSIQESHEAQTKQAETSTGP